MAHKVTLTWNAPTTGDNPATYEIQRAATAAGPFTTIGTTPFGTNTFVDTNVNAGDAFVYQVLSKNAAGESGPSNEVTASIPFLGPGAPLSLVAVAV